MARSYYMIKGVSPKALSEKLSRLPGIAEEEAAAAAVRVAEAAKDAAERACPSSQIEFSVVEYGSDKGSARLIARGPKLRPVKGGYSVPLATILEYGTGLYGDRSYGAEHRYVVDMGGKGAEGWTYPDSHDKNDSGKPFHRTHGLRPSYYMRAGSEAATAEAARILSEAVAESARRAGL